MEKILKNAIKDLYKYGLEKSQELQKMKLQLDEIKDKMNSLINERDKAPEPFKPNFDSQISDYENQINELGDQLSK